jgi:hypothetical protein
MHELFDLGNKMASKGFPWLKHPPGFDPVLVLKSRSKWLKVLITLSCGHKSKKVFVL